MSKASLRRQLETEAGNIHGMLQEFTRLFQTNEDPSLTPCRGMVIAILHEYEHTLRDRLALATRDWAARKPDGQEGH